MLHQHPAVYFKIKATDLSAWGNCPRERGASNQSPALSLTSPLHITCDDFSILFTKQLTSSCCFTKCLMMQAFWLYVSVMIHMCKTAYSKSLQAAFLSYMLVSMAHEPYIFNTAENLSAERNSWREATEILQLLP